MSAANVQQPLLAPPLEARPVVQTNPVERVLDGAVEAVAQRVFGWMNRDMHWSLRIVTLPFALPGLIFVVLLTLVTRVLLLLCLPWTVIWHCRNGDQVNEARRLLKEWDTKMQLAERILYWLEKLGPQQAESATVQLVNVLNPAQLDILNVFLGRLQKTAEFKKSRENCVCKVAHVLQALCQNIEFRETALLLLEDALSSCTDRVATYLGKLVDLWDLTVHPPQSDQEYAQRLVGHKRLDLLEQQTEEIAKIQDFFSVGPIERADPIEIGLFLQVRAVQAGLQLPASATQFMNYAPSAHVSEADADAAVREVRSQTSSVLQQINILSEPKYKDRWEPYLKNTYGQRFEQITKEFEERQDQLFDRSTDMTSEEYDKAMRQVMNDREKAIKDLVTGLTGEILSSQSVFDN